MKYISVFLLFFSSCIHLLAQTGINTVNPNSRLEIKGTSSIPGSSGSTSNGVLRLSEGANSNLKAIDFGFSGTSYGWIQPRLNSDYSQNYNLLLNPNGGAVIIGNSSGSATLNVGGTVTASGTIRSSQSGQLLNTIILNESDLSISSNQSVVNTTQTILTYTYTPVSSSSKIIIEFHGKHSIPGSSNDEWKSHLLVGNSTLQTQRNIWSLADGGGGRGSTLFPLTGVYSNTNGSQITIKVNVEEVSGDDTFTLNPDVLFTIKEVAQ
ncbi:MAG: hypothetical protein NBV77_06400 [Bacteroidia bacterium]|nr:hypothetical protein [Bacteroidia bacterium]